MTFDEIDAKVLDSIYKLVASDTTHNLTTGLRMQTIVVLVARYNSVTRAILELRKFMDDNNL